MLACLIGYLGDFDLAEEAAAEAFAIAAQRWPGTGMPDNPGAWLVTTARHRAIDRLRRDRVLAAKLPLLAEPEPPEPGEDAMTGPPIPDERLELVFMCCHPALGIEAQVALMLLHDARREARFDGQDLVLLPGQDRSRWDWRQIAEARDLRDRALLDPALLAGRPVRRRPAGRGGHGPGRTGPGVRSPAPGDPHDLDAERAQPHALRRSAAFHQHRVDVERGEPDELLHDVHHALQPDLVHAADRPVLTG